MRYYFPTSRLRSAERRGLERFGLRFKAKVEVVAPQRKKPFYLITNNVSASGAYFHTLHPLPQGTRVRVTITVTSEFVRQVTGFESRITIEGDVVRSTRTGMGIRFNEIQEIERIEIAQNCISKSSLDLQLEY